MPNTGLERRGLLRNIAIAVTGGSNIGLMQSHGTKSTTVEGHGKSVNEAFQNAIKAVNRANSVPDGVVRWKLKEISGEEGGLTSQPKAVVVLEVVT